MSSKIGYDPLVKMPIVSRSHNRDRITKNGQLEQETKNEQDRNVGRRLLFKNCNHAAMLLIKFDFSKANVIAEITGNDYLRSTYLLTIFGKKLITLVQISQCRIVIDLSVR